MRGREDSEKATMLLDLEASCLALMSTDDVRQTVTLQELHQRVGTAEEREREGGRKERERETRSQMTS